MKQSPPEPPRSLIGMTAEDLKEFERYLPHGAQIYTYPVGESNRAGAISSADLDDDGKAETIVVYNERKPTPEEGSLALTLSVLQKERNKLRVLASTGLLGGVLFRIRIDGTISYLAALDMNGDGHPEIVVAPATGASVGGWLQVLSFDGSTLHELAHTGGHIFRVRTRGFGKPRVIEARSKDEDQFGVYEWNGGRFEEVSRLPAKRR